jgi:hypothetical protein
VTRGCLTRVLVHSVAKKAPGFASGPFAVMRNRGAPTELVTDSRLRDLERRHRLTGSVEDEAAWLRARVQAGELEQSKLELAASLGHAAAAQLLTVAPLPLRFTSTVLIGDPGDWPEPRTARRSAILMEIFGESAEGQPANGLDPESIDKVPRSEWDAWLLGYPLADEPRRRVSVAVAAVAYRSYADGRSFGTSEWVTEELWALEESLLRGSNDYELRGEGAASAASEARGTSSELPAEAVASAAAAFLGGDRAELLLAAAKAAVQSGEQFRHLLAAELVPWLLGSSDPVRERVDARRREAAGE